MAPLPLTNDQLINPPHSKGLFTQFTSTENIPNILEMNATYLKSLILIREHSSTKLFNYSCRFDHLNPLKPHLLILILITPLILIGVMLNLAEAACPEIYLSWKLIPRIILAGCYCDVINYEQGLDRHCQWLHIIILCVSHDFSSEAISMNTSIQVVAFSII